MPLHHTQLVLNRPTTDRVIFPLTFGGVGHPQLEFLGVSGHPQWLRHWSVDKNWGGLNPTPNTPANSNTGYGMICHRSLLFRQSCHFEWEFDRVLLQLADTMNTQFKYREGSWHSLLKRLKCWRKSCVGLIRYCWIFRAWLHVHLKKWTVLACRLLNLNQISYFIILIKFAG